MAPADPAGSELIRAYLSEIIGRYYGLPAGDPDEVDAFMKDNSVFDLPLFLEAWFDGESAGCVGMGVLPGGIGELKRLYIRPEFRRRGGAAALLAEVERRAAEMGLHAMRLDTRTDLVEARTLYAKHGYAEIEPYHHGLYAEHFFEKRLTEPGVAAMP